MPFALLPSFAMLWLAGFLLSDCGRDEWRKEWTGEVWYRWNALRSSGAWTARSALQLYRTTAGCFPDAWSEFRNDDERSNALRAQVRSPSFCVLVLAFGALVVGSGSGAFKSTRSVLSTMPYRNTSRLALVSRTGRLESIRKGIPANLANLWMQNGKLLEAVAFCSLSPPSIASVEGHSFRVSSLQATTNLLAVIGQPMSVQTDGSNSIAFVSFSFWRNELKADPKILQRYITHHSRRFLVAGVLPEDFWFVSPFQILELGDALQTGPSMLLIRAKPNVTASQLENELTGIAERNDMPFTQTAPHVLFVAEALHAPIWLFCSALLMAAVVIGIGHGSRLRRSDRADTRLRFGNLQWWLFMGAKTAAALALVFATGIELLISPGHQLTTEPLGGPALLWFYTAGCSLVLLAVIADQQARCRLCLQCLAFPIRVGCPGCLFLDWSGTELLCPQGHGVLYVPHHQSCWDEVERWVWMEI